MDARFDDLLNTVITQKGQGIYGFFDVFYTEEPIFSMKWLLEKIWVSFQPKPKP